MADASPQIPRRRAALLAVAVALVGLAADQGSKWWVLRHLDESRPVPVIGDWFRWQLAHNPGAAFSLGTSATWVFTLLAIVALLGIAGYVLPRLKMRGWAVIVGLFCAGIAGNLTDRLLRPPAPMRGHVVDFISVGTFPIFNVADSMICVAAGLMVLASFVGRYGFDGRPLRADDTRDAVPDSDAAEDAANQED